MLIDADCEGACGHTCCISTFIQNTFLKVTKDQEWDVSFELKKYGTILSRKYE